ncbi:sugar ABC transporter permease [Hoeflea sp. EC-HK425]|mgnify:CR=1 FL=1|uniref:carbohydrate ABC transporter permease n=1 Tax=Hoeflea sp. EC-HK425 TaxID=2038388 RepID=UPI001256ED7B|nr:sugar ABC transporter permease [Hoeflea sp. EC-HK425]VVT27977.1 Raffinose/stachyose/melibiose transport system permease protein [Hoeflea sp. EC-HK425]|tara:strand:+ start:5079 stop:5978 length:900 start_codon:yes stop_codon:yes gene_type:complete
MTTTDLFRTPRGQAVVLMAPALAVYSLFAIWPMIDVVILSLQDWNGIEENREWVGLRNYYHILYNDPVFWVAFRNTVIWTIMSVVFPPVLGLMLALGLNQNLIGRAPLRAIYYLPVIIAPIAVATMWRWMYDPFFGLFTQMLTDMGLSGWVVDWLGDKDVALYSIFVAYVWQSVGFSMVLFLAGLQSVDKSLIDAAHIDGANRREIFKHVTLPALRPTITIVLVLSTISSLKAFDIVYGMTGGGPAQSTQMLALWAFTQSMQIFDYGRGSAVSVVLLAITLVIVVPYMRWSQRREEEVR